MLESHTEELAKWTVGQCAFTIEYSLRVMDDIRLAVVDAFFSLPRGGAEIGGILLGRNENRRVTVTDYLPLDCEHAFGPSFVLSPKDHAKLAGLMASARGNPGSTYPVGWYHSHTRSEILLTSADLDIHKRYFPEPWQVALVLKPHTFQPAKAGFFFRESDGTIHATASYREFVLEPLAVRPLPDPSAAASPTLAPRRPQPELTSSVIAITAKSDAETRSTAQRFGVAPLPTPVEVSAPATVPEPQAEPPVPPPGFTQVAPSRSWSWLGVVLSLSVGLVGGAAAYQTRQLWLPRLTWAGAAPPARSTPYLGLNTLDTDGQLQIRWDRESPVVRNADEAILVIENGALPQAIQLDASHLRAGSFTYARQSERVDVALTVRGPDGQKIREVATFLGKLPARKPAPEDPAARQQRDDLTRELQGRTQKLERTLEDLRTQLRNEQKRKRMENQSPDSVK
jgi:proteasome lid subunit RPN8/RPN11